jgi:hypothetical protein
MTECDHATCESEAAVCVRLTDGTLRVWCDVDAHEEDAVDDHVRLSGRVSDGRDRTATLGEFQGS